MRVICIRLYISRSPEIHDRLSISVGTWRYSGQVRSLQIAIPRQFVDNSQLSAHDDIYVVQNVTQIFEFIKRYSSSFVKYM